MSKELEIAKQAMTESLEFIRQCAWLLAFTVIPATLVGVMLWSVFILIDGAFQ